MKILEILREEFPGHVFGLKNMNTTSNKEYQRRAITVDGAVMTVEWDNGMIKDIKKMHGAEAEDEIWNVIVEEVDAYLNGGDIFDEE